MPPDFESLGSIHRAVVGELLLFLAAYGLGGMLVRSPNRLTSRAVDQCLIRIAVGLNLLGALGVILGTAKLLGGSRPAWLIGAFVTLALPVAWRTHFCARRPPYSFVSSHRVWLAIPWLLFGLV